MDNREILNQLAENQHEIVSLMATMQKKLDQLTLHSKKPKGSIEKQRVIKDEIEVFNKYIRKLEYKDDSYNYLDLLFDEYKMNYGVDIIGMSKIAELDPLTFAENEGLIPRLFILAYQLFED